MPLQPLVPSQSFTDGWRWTEGIAQTRPRVGDLWVVAWDGEDLGLVLLVAVRDSHVVIWPVTDERLVPSNPCFRLAAEWISRPLVCWPEAEAGMSYALLDRNLGEVIDSRTTAMIHAAIRGRIDPPNDVDFYPRDHSDAASDALADVCQHSAGLCELDWPALGEQPRTGVLNPAFVNSHDLSAEVLDKALGEAPAVAREVLAGKRLLPAKAAESLIRQFHASLDEILVPPSGAEVRQLRLPARKARIRAIAKQWQVSENVVRDAVWERSLVAARQIRSGTAEEAAAARVDNALDELVQPE